jgi:hypothetical protein
MHADTRTEQEEQRQFSDELDDIHIAKRSTDTNRVNKLGFIGMVEEALRRDS